MAREAPPDFRRIQARALKDTHQFTTLLRTAGIELAQIGRLGTCSMSAMRAPEFVSLWVSIPESSFLIPRAGIPIATRTVFVFANSGEAVVAVDNAEMVLKRGEVASASPGASTISLDTIAERNDILLFSTNLPADAAGIENQNHAPLSRLTDATLNAFTYSACFGLAHSPAPASYAVGDTVHSAAASLARALITRVPAPTETNLYRAALRFISERAADPELSAATVAEHFGASPRTLQLRFRAADDTVVRAIRRSRVAIARMLWRREPSLPAAAVAARSGFSSTRLLRRALHEPSPTCSGNAPTRR
ncbi:MAG: hypothetical protein ACTIA6_18330 [Pseudoclavibacter sp.]